MCSAADRAPEPWANGLGSTRELARDGGDDWRWRVSLARSTAAADFSHLPGVERLLVLAHGRSLRLAFADGEQVVLDAPGDCARFSGDRGVRGTPEAGETEQLNLMWKPDRVEADWSVLEAPATVTGSVLPGAARVWHVIDGHANVHGQRLEAGTTAVARPSAQVTVSCDVFTGTTVELTLTGVRTPPAPPPTAEPQRKDAS